MNLILSFLTPNYPTLETYDLKPLTIFQYDTNNNASITHVLTQLY